MPLHPPIESFPTRWNTQDELLRAEVPHPFVARAHCDSSVAVDPKAQQLPRNLLDPSLLHLLWGFVS